MEHLTLGHLEFEHITLQVLNNPDVRIMIYSPLAEIRAKLQGFLEAMANQESSTNSSHKA